MKKTFVSLLLAIVLVASSAPAFGSDSGGEMAADVLFVRPVSLVATVVGTLIFVVALPFSIPSGSVESTAKKLIVEPFQFTFARPIGEFDESINRSSTQ